MIYLCALFVFFGGRERQLYQKSSISSNKPLWDAKSAKHRRTRLEN